MPSIADIIRDRASAYGVDPDMLLRFGQAESSLNPNAGATTSSAKGLFQFTDPTWRDYGKGADPFDATANADAAARLVRDNGAALRAAGIEPNAGSLYLAHFAGLGGAKKLLTADDATAAGDVLGPAAVKANPFLARMTVADLRNWATGKVGGGPGSSPAAPTSGMPAAAMSPAAFAAPMASPPLAVSHGSVDPFAGLNLGGLLSQPAAAPPLPTSTLAAPPPRRPINPVTFRQALMTPLLRGSSFGKPT